MILTFLKLPSVFSSLARKRFLLFFIGVVFLVNAPSAQAWWGGGHAILSEAAVASLPEEIPVFFREQAKAVAYYSLEPDLIKNKAAPHATSSEYAEHFFNWEYIEKPLKYAPLPATRYEFLRFCFQNKIEANRVGYLPYAVAEWTERLMIAFAEHRQRPDDKRTQGKCLLYAGILAHYAQDLSQPLHLTVHHNGRARADGSSSRTGVHDQVDALIEAAELSPKELAQEQRVQPLQKSLLPEIMDEIHTVRTLVETVYSLERELPVAGRKLNAAEHPQVLLFVKERGRAATGFTAALFLTAWRHSAEVRLPHWLRRKD